MAFVWLTSVETSEQVGIPVARITMIERKTAREGHVVAIFIDTGKEIRVVETLTEVRAVLDIPTA